MAFVQGKCENCGGILAVDPSLKAAICPFCGTAYVVQDSINNYNTTIKVETMHANVVNITDESSSEARLKAADAYMKIGEYSKAEEEYTKVTELTPQNYKGWLGLIDSCTFHYTKRIKSADKLEQLKKYANSVSAFSPNGSSETILSSFTDYIYKEEEKNASERSKLKKSLSKNKRMLKELREEKNSLKERLEDNEERADYLSTNNNLDTSNSFTKFAFFLGIGLLFTPIGGITLCMALASSPNDPTIPGIIAVGITMLIIGVGGVILTILEKLRLERIRREINRLYEESEELASRIKSIIKQRTDIKLEISRTQELLEEYN